MMLGVSDFRAGPWDHGEQVRTAWLQYTCSTSTEYRVHSIYLKI
jgi:hypothetical protein